MSGELPFPIVFEDVEALVIDKPAGLPVTRPRRGGTSLDDYLPTLRLGFKRLPLPVHRLDQDTSGCLLLARNPKAHRRLSLDFSEQRARKIYVGILSGRAPGERGLIDVPLAKISTPETGWRMIPDPDGKPARTHWRCIAEHEGLSLIAFRPETGRTHQIRVHVGAALGAPLLGDPIYGDASEGLAPRTMLHSYGLVIARPGKRSIAARAPLPADFLSFGFEHIDSSLADFWDEAGEQRK